VKNPQPFQALHRQSLVGRIASRAPDHDRSKRFAIANLLGARGARRPTFMFLAALCAIALLTGCQTYKSQNAVTTDYWQRGDVAAAERESAVKAQGAANGRDAVIWQLEHASILRAAGKFEDSVKAFDVAEEKVNQYAEQAKVKLGREAAATMSNQANLPYEGRDYDGIMLNTYKALDYLTLGDAEKARVEIIRAYQRQQDAVENNKRRIEQAQEEEQQAKDKEKIEKARENERFKTQMNSAFGELDTMKTYADYVNPFTVFLDGLLFACNATGASDLERAHKSFERAVGFNAENKFLKGDLEAVDALIQGKQSEPVTYVIFETGRAPIRDQIRIDIPIIFANVSYVGAAFPKLQFQSDHVPKLTVTTSSGSETTEVIASMDSVVAHAFKNELPTIITKTMISTIAKAAAAYGVNQAASQQDNIAGLITRLATAGYQAAVNIADTRTWTTLPKEFQYCRIAAPPDRKLELQTPSGQKTAVTLGDGAVNVVYVRSISAAAPLLVSQFKLK
jgi:hypothetical protein